MSLEDRPKLRRRNTRSPRTAAPSGVSIVSVSCARAAAIVGLGAVLGLCWPSGVHAGSPVRVAVTDTPTDLEVGGGRVFWGTWDGDDASVFSAGLTTGARRLLHVRDMTNYDWVSPFLWASSERVAAQVRTHFAGVDADYYATVESGWGRVGDARLRDLKFPSRSNYFDEIQDIAGDDVLSTVYKDVRGQSTVRAYVRSGAQFRPVGPRLTLDDDEILEARLARRWMAVMPGHDRRITVYDRGTGRPAWSVQLPRNAGRPPYEAVWDLGEDGTVAVAFNVIRPGARISAALGWARPRAAFRRVTRAVATRSPFVLRAGTLTYAAPDGKNNVRLYSRVYGGKRRALTGKLPSELVASDGHLVAVAASGPRDQTCLLAATLPVAPSEPWRCPA